MSVHLQRDPLGHVGQQRLQLLLAQRELVEDKPAAGGMPGMGGMGGMGGMDMGM
ncbi:MAG: hypothetical protein FJ100_22275 [Deltaproteobacteria bacterium]|nr:hypothetical protein [Deltaproteobacteria bacterium]